jgi:uncharacterized membrane protein YdjX (TVP38/TMEM64 family)
MRWRLAIIVVLLVLALGAMAAMLLHPAGREVLSDPQQAGQQVRHWVLDHPVWAEGVLLLAYTVLTVVAIPVWWINVLAGYSFGLIGGTIRCVIAAAIAAAVTAHLWKYLAGDLAHSDRLTRYRIVRMLESYALKYGFSVVLVTRLARLLPLGLSNYIFGMLEIPWPKVFAGTLIGIIPSVATYAAIGAGAEWRSNLPFIIGIAIVSITGVVSGSYIYARHARHRK